MVTKSEDDAELLWGARARVAAFALSFALSLSPDCLAEAVLIDGAGYQVNKSMAENLKSHIGKRVSVYLDAGQPISGRVKAVGKDLVHIEQLDGKEYFDALIRIDEIVGFETRFREYRR